MKYNPPLPAMELAMEFQDDILLHYKDVCLYPRYSELTTRSAASVKVEFLGRKFNLPVVPSNMKCVIDEKLSAWFSENNYFYIMHRFGDVYSFVRNNQDLNFISISVGVKEGDRQLLQRIKNEGLRVDFITIDIAHGHSILMKDMLEFIKSLNLECKIIAGNIASQEAYSDLARWGADCIKVGIGGGSACSTKNKTGFTVPMFSCIKDISNWRFNDDEKEYDSIPIIADGGIREHADIVKAIYAGADMVMAGSIFSRLIDSPAELINGSKVYFGSASQFNKGEYKNVEGIKRTFELEPMTYKDKLREIEQDLQSAVSYSGGTTIYDVRNAICERVTHWDV